MSQTKEIFVKHLNVFNVNILHHHALSTKVISFVQKAHFFIDIVEFWFV